MTVAVDERVEARGGHAAPQVMARIPESVRASLSDTQMAALVAAFTPLVRQHRMAWRVSTRLFGRRFYLAILSGREVRSIGRVGRDGQAMSFSALLARIILFAGWITLATLVAGIAGVVLIYLVKSYLGIDLMDGPSFLHHYFF